MSLFEAATAREAEERKQLGILIAYAVNDPKHLEKVTGKGPQRGSPTPEHQAGFVQEQWWPGGGD